MSLSSGRILFLVVCLISLGNPRSVKADVRLSTPSIVEAQSVRDDLGLRMKDGQTLRLRNIAFPDDITLRKQAATFLENYIHRPIGLLSPVTDRYGRIVADAVAAPATGGEAQSLSELLVTNGLAFVYPTDDDTHDLKILFSREAAARQRKQAIWALPAYTDTPAENADTKRGGFAFITGTVVEAERIKSKTYLNFGADHHHDFTAVIAAHDNRAFQKAGLDPLSLQGKTLHLRGWVNGITRPTMTLDQPTQIEILTK